MASTRTTAKDATIPKMTKPFSYVVIMKTLVANALNVPVKKLPGELSAKMARRESWLCDTRDNISKYASRLKESTYNIEQNINSMKPASRSSALTYQGPSVDELKFQYSPWQAEAKERMQQREKLFEAFKKLEEELRSLYAKIKKLLTGGKLLSLSMIFDELNKIEKKSFELYTQANQLNINEENLQHKLDNLELVTYHSLKAINPESVAGRPAPKM